MIIKSVLLGTRLAPAVWQMRSAEDKDMVLKPEPVLRLLSLLVVRDAVLASAGAALLPKILVAADIAAGRLAYWGTHAAPPVEIWSLQSSRRLVSTKVHAFLDVVERAFPKRSFISPK